MADIGSSERVGDYRAVDIHRVKPVDRDGRNAQDDFRDSLDRRKQGPRGEAGEEEAAAPGVPPDQILLSGADVVPAPEPGATPDAYVPVPAAADAPPATPPPPPPDGEAAKPGERRVSPAPDEPAPPPGGHLQIQA